MTILQQLLSNINKRTLLNYIIEAVIFIAIIAAVWGCYSDKLNDSEQNLKAAKGYITQVELKNGELLNARDSYIASINDLEELLDISKQEIKDIQRQLDSKVAYISKIEAEVRIKYIETVRDSIIYINNDPQIATSIFRYNDKWVDLIGRNEFTFDDQFKYNTTIESLNINVPLNVGLTNDYQIFVKTPNPYVSFSNIDGAVIDNSVLKPRKKRFSWGIHGGIGVMYDVIDNDIAVGPTASFGVHINF
jgi:hypothetical protein